MRVRVQFKPQSPRLKVGLNGSTQRLPVKFDGFHGVTVVQDAETYEGAVEITPKIDGQILPTKGKLMPDDVTVKAIPCYTVDNSSGGLTVYIASEV